MLLIAILAIYSFHAAMSCSGQKQRACKCLKMRSLFAAIRSKEDAWERHVEDSLSLLPALDKCLHGNDKPASIIDVGNFYLTVTVSSRTSQHDKANMH